MIIKFNLAALKETSAKDYVIRFVLGGITTVAAGMIATKFGPTVGGLFLAFPAIFPATATLIAEQQTSKKEREGLSGVVRGRLAAALEARGTSLGAPALAIFLLIVWLLVKKYSPSAVLLIATIAWLVAAVSIWLGFKRLSHPVKARIEF